LDEDDEEEGEGEGNVQMNVGNEEPQLKTRGFY
jgi:hypothetical protein